MRAVSSFTLIIKFVCPHPVHFAPAGAENTVCSAVYSVPRRMQLCLSSVSRVHRALKKSFCDFLCNRVTKVRVNFCNTFSFLCARESVARAHYLSILFARRHLTHHSLTLHFFSLHFALNRPLKRGCTSVFANASSHQQQKQKRQRQLFLSLVLSCCSSLFSFLVSPSTLPHTRCTPLIALSVFSSSACSSRATFSLLSLSFSSAFVSLYCAFFPPDSLLHACSCNGSILNAIHVCR